MPDEIQPYRGPSGGGEIQLAEPPVYPDEGPSTIAFLATLRRRWLMVLLVWLLLAGCSIPCIWLFVKRTYTATAQLQVVPVLKPILYPDNNSAMPFFEPYLHTQAELICSHQVLTAALADPGVQGLEILNADDPVAALRNVVSAKKVGRAHLLEISVTQADPESSVRLTKAVVDAYMARIVGAEEAEQRKKLKILEDKRAQLGAQLEQNRKEIQELAQEYGTATDSMFDVLREGVVQSSLETRREQERAELDIIQLREELRQLEQGVTGSFLSQEEASYSEQAIENDPVVVSLRQQLLTVSSQLLRLQSNLTDEHAQVIAMREEKERLDQQLKTERDRAAEAVKASLKRRLAAAEHRRDVLAERVKEEEVKGMAIGRRGLEIQMLLEEAERIKQDYDQVNEAIKREDMERYRPARVSVASAAEVRPSGVEDKRIKLSLGLLFGTAVASMGLALLRGHLDSHLYTPEEVEEGIGLRMLAIVPRLSDLTAGYVTKEDFIESYRWVRATLSAIGEDGSPPKSILITSAQAAEGKTSLAVSLAASLAEPGNRVLLIDSDLQAPGIKRLLKLNPTGGLETLLQGKKTLAECVTMSNLPGVDVLAAGINGDVANQSLNYRSATRILQEAAKSYDHIVIDSSPALSAANTLVWAHIVDGVVISSLASQSNTVAMRLACQRLKSVGANLLGSVIGNVSQKESFFSYSASVTSVQVDESTKSRGGKSIKRKGPPVVQLPDNDMSS